MRVNKKFDLIFKIILTILFAACGIAALIIKLPGKEIFASIIYALCYCIVAICIWSQDKNKWIKGIMEAMFIITFIFSLMQWTTGIPLGIPNKSAFIESIAVISFLLPVLGLLYFNLNNFNNWQYVVLIILDLLLTAVFAVLALMSVLDVTIGGNTFLLMKSELEENLSVLGMFLITFLDIVFIILNWLKIYRGVFAWISSIVILVINFPAMLLAGFIDYNGWSYVALVIFVLFTTYWNNRVKINKKA